MRTIYLAVLIVTSACGGGGIGDDCETVGRDDECTQGAICTKEEDGIARCRIECDEHEDCPRGHDCNGVSKTKRKSCQPDEDSDEQSAEDIRDALT